MGQFYLIQISKELDQRQDKTTHIKWYSAYIECMEIFFSSISEEGPQELTIKHIRKHDVTYNCCFYPLI